MSRPSSRVTRRAVRNDVGVADLDDPVDDARVERRRPEVLADAFDQVRPAGAARVHRARRVGADDLHARVPRLQRAADTGDRAAGADARDEVRDAARRSGRQISGPVVCSCASGLAGLEYWSGRNAPGVSRTSRSAVE